MTEEERRAAILGRLTDGEHRRLMSIVPLRPEDYDPWGDDIRWADEERAYPDCSCGCKWARWLEDLDDGKPKSEGGRGRLSMDWLVCTNPRSHRVGLLTFEHQGCGAFDPDETP